MTIEEDVWISDINVDERHSTRIVWESQDTAAKEELLARFGRRSLDTVQPFRVPALVGKELLAPMGQVAANYSVLEWLFERLLWMLVFPPATSGKHLREIGQPLTGRMSLDELGSQLKTLFPRRVLDRVLQERFEELRERVFKVKDERNSLIHARWTLPKHAREGVALKFSKGASEWKHRTWTAEEVEKLAISIAQLAGEVLMLSDETYRALQIDPAAE